METKDLLWQYQLAIQKIYEEQNLTSLRGLIPQHDYEIDGKQVLSWYYKSIEPWQRRPGNAVNYKEIMDDLSFCSDELMYFTANLFLYRPFLNNPAREGENFNGKMLYPNRQNMYAKKYNMFTDVVSEKAYNYWDRIGDLIASLFPERIKSKNIYFSTAMKAIPVEYHACEAYLWLKEFLDNEYVKMNNQRKQIVHYVTSDTKFKHKHLKNYGTCQR